jgi:hypothetical protein
VKTPTSLASDRVIVYARKISVLVVVGMLGHMHMVVVDLDCSQRSDEF